MARPTEWTPDRIKKATDLIFKRIVRGDSVRKILSTDEKDDLPSRKTFYEWMAVNKDLSDQYAKVMEIRSDDMADEILEIADNFEHDVKEDKDGREVIDHAVVNRDRLRVDARKWLLSKMLPKKYGDKTEIDNKISGSITINPKNWAGDAPDNTTQEV